MKKILALLLAAVMCLAFVAACNNDAPPAPPPPPPGGGGDEPGGGGGDPGTGEKSSRQLLAEQYGLPWADEMESWEPITLTYFDRNAGTPPADTNPIIKIIEEITNVKIEWQMNMGDLEISMGNMLSTGDVPDIAFFGGAVGPAIASGYFIPIDELIEAHAPRLRAHYEPWWDLMKYADDGRIYTAEIWTTYVGESVSLWANQSAFWIQKAVLEYFERAPADLDEYFDFLREYADVFPEIDGLKTVPFSILNHGVNGKFSLENGGAFLNGHANWGMALNTEGEYMGDGIGVDVYNRWIGDFQYDWYKKLNEEYHLGTFSREELTQTKDMYLAQLSTGVVLGVHDQLWNFNDGTMSVLEAEGRFERTMLPLGLTYEGKSPNYLDEPEFTGSNGINISTNNPDPIRTIKFMDYLIDESVQRLLHWGIEGEHYFYNENGRIERPQEQRELQQDQRWNTDNLGRFLRNAFPKMQGTYPSDGNGADIDQSEEEYFAGLSDYDKELFEKLGIMSQTGFYGGRKARPLHYPFWSFSPGDGTPERMVRTSIEDVFTNHVAAMVIGPASEFDARWEAYKAAILDIDVQPLVDFFQTSAEAKVSAKLGG